MNVNIALLTVTDTRTLKTDKSGNLLLKKIKKAKHNLIERKICKDNKKDIKKILKNWLKKKKIDVIITTGGTGLTGRDITPEAIEEIADKKIPGFGEIFRFISLKTVGISSASLELLGLDIEGFMEDFRFSARDGTPKKLLIRLLLALLCWTKVHPDRVNSQKVHSKSSIIILREKLAPQQIMSKRKYVLKCTKRSQIWMNNCLDWGFLPNIMMVSTIWPEIPN